MKPQELSQQELIAVNGGSDSAAQTGAGITISTDTLLSLNYSWSDGDRSYQSNLQVGKGLHTSIGGLNNSTQQ